MDPNDFFLQFKRHGGRFKSDIYGVPWGFWMTLTSIGEQIDFGCDFSDHKCIAYRSGSLDYLKSIKKRLCCHNCSATMGYLDFLKEDWDYCRIAVLFDLKTGFLGEQGCLLPFEYRSRTCLTHLCLFFQENPVQVSDIVNTYIEYLNNPGKLYSRYLLQQPDFSCRGDFRENYTSFILSQLNVSSPVNWL